MRSSILLDEFGHSAPGFSIVNFGRGLFGKRFYGFGTPDGPSLVECLPTSKKLQLLCLWKHALNHRVYLIRLDRLAASLRMYYRRGRCPEWRALKGASNSYQ